MKLHFIKNQVNRNLLFFILVSILTFKTSAQPQSSLNQKPNIILFLVDDMGWQDTSVPFYTDITSNNKKYHTPNMERLASAGVKFTNAYANSVCTPTRVSLMTGMNEAQHRVTNWTDSKPNAPTDADYPGLKWPNWNYNGLSPIMGISNTVVATSLPQVLNENGYYTIHVGKAHFASYASPATNPENIGFSVNIAGDAKGSPGSYLGTENFGNEEEGGFTLFKGNRGLEQYHGKDIFLTEALTLEAKKQMDKSMELKHPFFLYMAHYAVHSTYKPDKRFIQNYLNKGYPKVEAEYAALLEGMDKSLGDLMDYLNDKKIAENTIIIFMSDNGGLSLNPPRQGEANNENAPLRSGKASAYEGGIREPMMVYWPGKTQKATTNTQYVAIQDFMPSILEMAGIKEYKVSQKMDGKSFVPFLLDPKLKEDNRVLIWHSPTTWEQGAKTILSAKVKTTTVDEQGFGPTSTIRKGDWKLIYFYGRNDCELYNLKEDISEKNNLIGKNRDKARELMTDLNKELKDANAQYPIKISTGQEIKPQFN